MTYDTFPQSLGFGGSGTLRHRATISGEKVGVAGLISLNVLKQRTSLDSYRWRVLVITYPHYTMPESIVDQDMKIADVSLSQEFRKCGRQQVGDGFPLCENFSVHVC